MNTSQSASPTRIWSFKAFKAKRVNMLFWTTQLRCLDFSTQILFFFHAYIHTYQNPLLPQLRQENLQIWLMTNRYNLNDVCWKVHDKKCSFEVLFYFLTDLMSSWTTEVDI
jgi:hypothetical protein